MTEQPTRRERTADDILMGGGGNKSVSFTGGDRDAAPGAYVEGKIVAKRVAPDLDFKSKEPEFWPNGEPKEHPVITLQTSLHEEEGDDGLRDLHVKVSKQPGGMSREIAEAVRGAGDKTAAIGAWLRVDYTGKTQTGDGSTAHVYAAQYRSAADAALMGAPAAAGATPVADTTTPAAAAGGALRPDQIEKLNAINSAYGGLPRQALEALAPSVPGVKEALEAPAPGAAPAASGGELTPTQVAALNAINSAYGALPRAVIDQLAATDPKVAAALQPGPAADGPLIAATGLTGPQAAAIAAVNPAWVALPADALLALSATMPAVLAALQAK